MNELAKRFTRYHEGEGKYVLPDDARVALFASINTHYLAVYRPNGEGILLDYLPTGVVHLSPEELEARRTYEGAECTDEFEHNLDLAALDGLSAAERQEKIVDHFFSVVNPEFEDRVIRSYDELGENGAADGEIEFIAGSEEEFARLIRLFVVTDPELDVETGAEVTIQTEFDSDDAGLPEDPTFYTQRFERLLDIALEIHRPFGGEYQYNDGAYDRQSGYSPTPGMLSYQIDPPSAHERLEAIAALAAWIDGLSEDRKERLKDIRETLGV